MNTLLKTLLHRTATFLCNKAKVCLFSVFLVFLEVMKYLWVQNNANMYSIEYYFSNLQNLANTVIYNLLDEIIFRIKKK